MKLYITGQITGLTQEEYTTNFERAEKLVIANGYEALNPLKVAACLDENCNTSGFTKDDGSYLHSWSCYLKYDLIEMLKCDGIAALPNWHFSNGAIFETSVADRICMPMFAISLDYTELYLWRHNNV